MLDRNLVANNLETVQARSASEYQSQLANVQEQLKASTTKEHQVIAELTQSQTELEQYKRTANELTEQLAQAKQTQESQSNKIQQLENSVSNNTQQLTKDIDALTVSNQNYQAQVATLSEQLTAEKTNTEQLNAEHQTLKTQLAELESDKNDLNEQVTNLENALTKEIQTNKTLTEQLSAAQQDSTEQKSILSSENKVLTEKATALSETIAVLEAKAKENSDTMLALESAMEAEKNNYQALSEQLSQQEQNQQAAEDKLNTQLAEQAQTLSTLTQEHQALTQSNQDNTAQYQAEITSFEAKLAELTEALNQTEQAKTDLDKRYIKNGGDTTLSNVTKILAGSSGKWLNIQAATDSGTGFFVMRNYEGDTNLFQVNGDGTVLLSRGRMAVDDDEVTTKRYVDNKVSGGTGILAPGRRFKFERYDQGSTVPEGCFSPYRSGTDIENVFINRTCLDGMRVAEGAPDFTPGIKMPVTIYKFESNTWKSCGFGTWGTDRTNYMTSYIGIKTTWVAKPTLIANQIYAIVIGGKW